MPSFQSLEGKVAVVTGAAQGMGRGIAERLRDAGAEVVIADVEAETLARTAHELGVFGVRTDVTSFESVQGLADTVVERFGAVHVLVNNAGVGPLGPIADMTIQDWRWVTDVNLFGVIHGVQAFLPLLKANEDGGYIVNTASVSGVVSAPMTAAYAVSKFGVVALSEVLSQELALEGSRVGVSVLLPGPTRTSISTGSRNRPAGPAGLKDYDMEEMGLFESIPWKEPTQIGDIVIEAMARGELHVFTHTVMLDELRARHRTIEAAASFAESAAR